MTSTARGTITPDTNTGVSITRDSIDGEGIKCTLIYTATASGCGGYDGSDDDALGRSLYARAGWRGGELFADDIKVWESLWTSRRGELSKGARSILAGLGIVLPAAPREPPAWGSKYPGTRLDWERDQSGASEAGRAHRAAVGATLSGARSAWLVSRGWIPLRGWVGGAYMLVHDFGCRCSGGYGSFDASDGYGRIVARNGITYFVAEEDDIDAVLKAADTTQDAASRKARVDISCMISKMGDEQLLKAAKRPLPGDDLSRGEWVAQVTERAGMLRSEFGESVEKGDYSEVRGLSWPDYCFRVAPDSAGRRAYLGALEKSGAEELDPGVVAGLRGALVPTRGD